MYSQIVVEKSTRITWLVTSVVTIRRISQATIDRNTSGHLVYRVEGEEGDPINEVIPLRGYFALGELG